MSQATEFAHATSGEELPTGQAVSQVQFVDEDGKPVDLGGAAPDLTGYAKKADIPTIPKGVAVADAADAPTKDEFNALLKSLRDAGIIAS